MAEKSYRAWTLDQVMLLPRSLRDWLPADHLVYFVLDVVEELDLSAIERAIQAKEHRGERPWNPRMMVALLLFGYCVGVRSSRRIEKATYQDVAFRVLTADTQPDHSTIAMFRQQHLKALSALFLEILQLCQKAGMVSLGRVALDGTKMKANASKHKAMSYAFLKRRELELQAQIDEMLKDAATTDAAEDALHGRGVRGDELPAELRRKGSRQAVLRKAKADLEAEAKAAREAEVAEREETLETPPDEPPPLPAHRVRHNADGTPAEEAQRNFTDPDSRIMKSGKDFVQGYNAQAVVDEGQQIIVAAAVTNQPPDCQHLPAMIAAVETNLGARPVQVVADAGYYSAENAHFCERMGIDALLSVGRETHQADSEGRSPAAGGPRAAMRERLRSALGQAAYRRRKCIVEPVFGQIKDARGIRTCLLRGIAQVRGEWNLICLTHNLLKLFRFSQASALVGA